MALSLGSVSCGADQDVAPAGTSSTDELQICRDQWDEVASNVVGLDQDENPSALRKRWSNVLATVSIYQETDTAENCEENIEALSTGITQLRQFSLRLQPYDMEFQTDRVADDVTRYVSDPLPEPVRKGKKLVKPPTKQAVTAALATLTAQAAAANADLAPPWGQLNAIELTDTAAVESALQDLEFYAKDSTSWVACKEALKVINTAIRAMPPVPSVPSVPSASSSPTAPPSTTPAP